MKTTTTVAVLWLGVFALVLGWPQNDEDDMYAADRNLCRHQANLTDADFEIVMNHKVYEPKTRSTTPKRLQCYAKCFLERMQFYVNGEPNMKFFNDTLPMYVNNKAKARAALSKCGQLLGGDECERAFNFMSCLLEETGIYG